MPRHPKTKAGFDEIAAVVRAGHGRSPLFHWMRRHHDDFAAVLAENRPDWSALAQAFAEKLGFCGMDGKPLAPDTVRHTWWRARRDKTRRRQKRPQKPAPVVRVVFPAPMTATAPTPPVAAAEGDPLAELREQMKRRG